MGIGRMRHRLQIQSMQRTNDDGGGSSIQWSKVADIYADIQPQGEAEAVFGGQIRGVSGYKIYIRYRPDISVKDRLMHRYVREEQLFTRYYTISGISNVDSRYKYIELTCSEGAAQ